MKFILVYLFVLSSLFSKAQIANIYEFKAVNKTTIIDSITANEVITILQNRLTNYNYKNATCNYNTSSNSFLINSFTKINNDFIKTILLNDTFFSISIYELYNQFDIAKALSTYKLKKGEIGKLPLFLTLASNGQITDNFPYLAITSHSDSVALRKDILKFKKYMPADILFANGYSNFSNQNNLELFGLKNNTNKFYIGGFIINASISYDALGRVAITIEFNEKGKQKFANITGTNVNKNLAFVINNKVLTAPRVIGKIESSKVDISGLFTMQEATKFVNILNTEILPIKLKFVQSEIVTNK